jgi:hypothetical protein
MYGMYYMFQCDHKYFSDIISQLFDSAEKNPQITKTIITNVQWWCSRICMRAAWKSGWKIVLAKKATWNATSKVIEVLTADKLDCSAGKSRAIFLVSSPWGAICYIKKEKKFCVTSRYGQQHNLCIQKWSLIEIKLVSSWNICEKESETDSTWRKMGKSWGKPMCVRVMATNQPHHLMFYAVMYNK